MTVGDRIVSEIAETLSVSGEPPRFYFSAKPKFLAARLLALPLPDRKQVLEKVAVFAYFLAKEKSSPEAGRTILDILEDVAKRTLSPGSTA